MRRSTRRAFTLMELMTVLAILLILAAILIPVFARTKENGYKAVAMTQARQLGAAILTYTDGSDGRLLPSTNYGAPATSPGRMWTTVLKSQIKSEQVFIAPGSKGKFPGKWEDRGWGSIGYNSSTALDKSQGCTDDNQVTGCLAFKTVAQFAKQEQSSNIALFALTPEGEVKDKYLGYEFSPYNGTPDAETPELSPPLTSDRDLVKELQATLPAELIKPIFARYLATGSDDGQTFVIFGDSHAKSYNAKQINDSTTTKIVWRLR